MPVFLRRWLGAHNGARIAIGLLYLLINCTLPSYHTCISGHTNSLCDKNRCFYHESCNGTPSDNSMDEVVTVTKSSYLFGPCPACLYSITSTSMEVSSTSVALGNEVLISLLCSLSLFAIKQPEQLSRLYSRAPPAIIPE